jgi:hypothetical protein
VSKKTGEPEPENRKLENQGPSSGSGSGLEKQKTGYPSSGTRFLPGYREPGYIYIYIYIVRALHFSFTTQFLAFSSSRLRRCPTEIYE